MGGEGIRLARSNPKTLSLVRFTLELWFEVGVYGFDLDTDRSIQTLDSNKLPKALVEITEKLAAQISIAAFACRAESN
jgi:hypothetical protein